MEIVDDLSRVVGIKVGWSKNVVIADDRSQSESSGQCRRVQGGLILCYAQALGVVVVGSLLVELSGGYGYAVVVPPIVPRKGRTTASGVVIGVQGKSGNRPEDQGIHRKGEVGHEGLQTQ